MAIPVDVQNTRLSCSVGTWQLLTNHWQKNAYMFQLLCYFFGGGAGHGRRYVAKNRRREARGEGKNLIREARGRVETKVGCVT